MFGFLSLDAKRAGARPMALVSMASIKEMLILILPLTWPLGLDG